MTGVEGPGVLGGASYSPAGGSGAIQFNNGGVGGGIAPGAAGEVLTSNGVGVAPSFQSGGSGTVTSVSVVTANGVSGSVATSTTTPAITLTLGAITPTSVNGDKGARAYCQADGTAISSRGITSVANPGTGLYTIDYTAAGFVAAPTIVATAVDDSEPLFIVVSSTSPALPTSTVCTILITDLFGTPISKSFTVIIEGA